MPMKPVSRVVVKSSSTMITIRKWPSMVLVLFLICPHTIPMKQNNGIYINNFSFPLTGDFKKPEVFGLEGLTSLYKQTLGNLQFSGPGCLGDIITYAKQIAEFN